MARIAQEFYCNECDGYFMARLNMDLNYKVKIICPNCQHVHSRNVINGQIIEYIKGKTPARFDAKYEEEIVCPKSTYQKKPRHGCAKNARDGKILEDQPCPQPPKKSKPKRSTQRSSATLTSKLKSKARKVFGRLKLAK